MAESRRDPTRAQKEAEKATEGVVEEAKTGTERGAKEAEAAIERGLRETERATERGVEALREQTERVGEIGREAAERGRPPSWPRGTDAWSLTQSAYAKSSGASANFRPEVTFSGHEISATVYANDRQRRR